MKKIAAVVYALDADKGSESGMGYNFALNLAENHPDILIITRGNNQNHDFSNTAYEDLPFWVLRLKRMFKLHLLYYVLWQLHIGVKYRNKFDLVYQVNFHSDWLPLFSYLSSKDKWVVGPIGHHGSRKMCFQALRYNRWFGINFSVQYILKKFIYHLWNKSIIGRKAFKIYVLNKDHWFKRDERVIYLPSVGVEEIGQSIKKENVVLYVGRLVDLKGVRVLTDVARRNPDYSFRIIGDGPRKEMLEEACSDLRNIHFTGWLDRREVLKCYESARFLLFPSFEGAGMVVAEAASYGCIPIVLKGSGPSELLGSNCMLVEDISDFKDLDLNDFQLEDPSEIIQFVEKHYLFMNKKIAIDKV